MKPEVELVYFRGCLYVEAARQALRATFAAMGVTPEWKEWDQERPGVPTRIQGYGSPTVLIAGRDVQGGTAGTDGRACRADGPPSMEQTCSSLAAMLNT